MSVDHADADEYRSVNRYLRTLDPDELRILHERLERLEATEEWKSLAALLRVDREQHVRAMTSGRVLEHAQYAFEGGYVRGSATAWSILATVHGLHRTVQGQLRRDVPNDDGETR